MSLFGLWLVDLFKIMVYLCDMGEFFFVHCVLLFVLDVDLFVIIVFVVVDLLFVQVCV